MSDLSLCLPLVRSSVQAAHELIREYVHLTPVVTNTTLNNLASTPQTPEALVGTPWEGQTPANPKIRFWFKCENFQRIGAFKARGAFHALSRLDPEIRKKGIVTHSSGTRWHWWPGHGKLTAMQEIMPKRRHLRLELLAYRPMSSCQQ